ncbi:MAG: methyltransferase domain-containing protein [Bacteroidota bacterium]
MKNSNVNFKLDLIECQSCGLANLLEIYNFGKVPLAGYFPRVNDVNISPLIDMFLLKCNQCQLFQIYPDVPDHDLFEDYRYLSSVAMQQHFDNFADWFVNKFKPNSKTKILEIGCNDGPLLYSLEMRGLNATGIDPAVNIVKKALDKGLNVIVDSFGQTSVEVHNLAARFDYIISCNSFAHISNIDSVTASVSKSLNATGIFIVEVQSFYDLLNYSSFDFIYHEHKYYYNLQSIENLLKRHDLYLIDAKKIDTHGGSYRLVFSRSSENKSSTLTDLVNLEKPQKFSKNTVVESIENFMHQLKQFESFLQGLKRSNKKIIGFGASGRANMVLGYMNDPKLLIDAMYDESQERVGRYMANSGIIVKGMESLLEQEYDICVVFAWNYAKAIIEKWPHGGKRLIVPFPNFYSVNT